MYSHVMIGSNDLERSKQFYDALFTKPGRTDDKGRLSYGRRGAVFLVSAPINGEAATHGNGSTIGFKAEGETLVLLGHSTGHVGQSRWLEVCHDRSEGPPPPVDLAVDALPGRSSGAPSDRPGDAGDGARWLA